MLKSEICLDSVRLCLFCCCKSPTSGSVRPGRSFAGHGLMIVGVRHRLLMERRMFRSD